MRRYKVAIIEPSIIIAEGLCKILQSSAEADVVGIYPTLRDFAERRVARDIEVVIVVRRLCAAVSLYVGRWPS